MTLSGPKLTQLIAPQLFSRGIGCQYGAFNGNTIWNGFFGLNQYCNCSSGKNTLGKILGYIGISALPAAINWLCTPRVEHSNNTQSTSSSNVSTSREVEETAEEETQEEIEAILSKTQLNKLKLLVNNSEQDEVKEDFISTYIGEQDTATRQYKINPTIEDYKKFAEKQIANIEDDNNSDKALNQLEFLAKSLADNGVKIEDFNSLTNEEQNEIVAGNAITFSLLDANNDNLIDAEELGAYAYTHATMRLQNGTTNETYGDITYEEWVKTAEVNSTLQKLVLNLPNDQSKAFQNAIKTDLNEALKILINHANPTDEEKSDITYLFASYGQAIEAFRSN